MVKVLNTGYYVNLLSISIICSLQILKAIHYQTTAAWE